MQKCKIINITSPYAMKIRIKGASILIIANTSFHLFKVENRGPQKFLLRYFIVLKKRPYLKKMKLTLILLLMIGVYSAQGKNLQ